MPLIQKCGCLPLKTGCFLLCVLSTLGCIANIIAGAWRLPHHRERDPEDNLISLSMIMFSTLSAISDVMALGGIIMKRPGYLHLSLISNCVFIICIFVVALVNCIFRMEVYFQNPLILALVVLSLWAGVAYSVFYLMVVNSYYRAMKMDYVETAIPI